MVIRAWVEEGSQQPLRVEVRPNGRRRARVRAELVLSEPAGVEKPVRAWAADVLANG